VGILGMTAFSGLPAALSIVSPISFVLALGGTILCGTDRRWHEDQFLRVMCRVGSIAVLIGVLLILEVFAVWPHKPANSALPPQVRNVER